MTDPRKSTQTAAANIAAAARQLPGALEALRQRSTALDGYPTSTPGAGPYSGPGSRHTCDRDPEGCDACHPVALTATERAALAQARHDQQRAEVDIAAEVMANATARFLELVLRYNPLKDDHPRCTGGAGMDGALEWGDPLCANVAAPDRQGLCYACAKRRQRTMTKRGEAA